MNRPPLNILGSVAAIVCVCAGLTIITVLRTVPHSTLTSNSRAAQNAGPVEPVARAAFGQYVIRVHALGRVGPPSGGAAKLAFTNAGIVARVNVRVGQVVSAGDSLAELDAAGLAIGVAQAQNDAAAAAASFGGGTVPERALASAQARLTAARDRLRALRAGTTPAQMDDSVARAAVLQAAVKVAGDRRALDRQVTLYAGGVAAHKEVEAARQLLGFDQADAEASRAKAASAHSSVGVAFMQARADVAQGASDERAAQAQVTVAGAQASSAQARYAAAQRLMALATLRAPANGVVIAILKQRGEAVDPSQPAIVVGPRASSDAALTVAGAEARFVQPGERVRITVPSLDRTVDGRVRAVIPTVDPATQAVTVIVTGSPTGSVPGDAVDATIDVGRRHGIVIPTSAVVDDPQSGKSLVFVRERSAHGSQRFVAREIVVANGNEQTTLVASGLRGGEDVATQGAFDLLAPSGG